MADSFGGQAGGLGGVIAAFGGSDKPPVPVYFPGAAGLLQRGARLGRQTYDALQAGLPAFRSAFEHGTQRQLGLQNEQADIIRSLTQRALARDPQQQLRETGNTLFSFIDPNVIEPLSRYDVNFSAAMRRARGLGGDAFDSTADRLRRSRDASRRLYDVAQSVYAQIPSAFNQVRNAGITDELLAAGYIPQLQQGYRNIDMSGLIPLQASVDLTRGAFGIPADFGAANRANAYGYHQPMNLADRFGAAGQSMWNTVKDAAQIYASLYGGGIGGGGGAAPARPPATTLPAAGSPYYTGYPSPTAYA